MRKTSIAICSIILLFTGIYQPLVLGQVPAPVQLNPSTTNADQDFGYAVDLDGTVAVVGAFRDESISPLEAGAAFVYRFNGTTWEEEARLESSSIESFDWFGWDVAVSGDVILVTSRNGDELASSAGDVTVFRYNGSNWVEETILIPSDGDENADFGFGIDIDGDIAAAGGPDKTGLEVREGIVYVYRYNGVAWVEDGMLTASDAGGNSFFGSAISIDGDRILVGAFNAADANGALVGKMYVYEHDGAQWNETAILQADNANNLANLGVSVSLEGDWAVGGAPLDNELNNGAGAAHVFHFDGTNWRLHQKLTATTDGEGFFLFGTGVSVSENRILVGADNWAPAGEGSTGKGYLFEYDAVDDRWTEIESFAPDNAGTGDQFGQSVALQGEVMLVGAPEFDAPGSDGIVDDRGAAYIYGVPSLATANEAELPISGLAISRVYPNPFTNRSTVQVTSDIDQAAHIVLSDMLGREVKTIFAGRLGAGSSTILPVEAGDLPAGVYWIKITTPGQVLHRSITLVR